MKADPGAVSWAGGSAGGVDHITVGFWPRRRAWTRPRSTTSPSRAAVRRLAAILGNQVTAGISGVGEFLPQVAGGHDAPAGRVVGCEVEGVDAPTLIRIGL
jgi:putative tricarboxylic transport membrane protein